MRLVRKHGLLKGLWTVFEMKKETELLIFESYNK